jgi:hypothetical protein
MALPLTQIRHQVPVIAAFGDALVAGLWRQVSGGSRDLPPAPGAEIRQVVSPPAEDLIRDFVTSLGGDPTTWRGVVPPHLFPHWSFPLVAQTFRALPYPLWRVLNVGCRMELDAPIPAGESLEVSARLETIDAEERRVVCRTRVTTGTRSAPRALVADLFSYIPLAAGGSGGKSLERAPAEARELARWRLDSTAGLEFALLTGDFNPIHWVWPYARLAGFRGVILHGFGTFGRTVESLVRAQFAGDAARLRSVELRYRRPLVLPADVGLYADGERIFVADGREAPSYAAGSFSAAAR